MKKIFSTIFVMLSFFYLANGLAAEEFQVQIPGRTVNLTYQVIDDNRLLVAAKDAENNPIKGLNVEDFVIKRGIKKAKIQSVETLETSEFVPLNIVLVIDNSFSMKERRAVKPLLAALDEFFKTVRPIDNVHLVVFNNKGTIKVKDYRLHAQSFHSGFTPQLKQFITEAFDSGLTGTTFLHEAMVAGIDIIRMMPEEDQKFLVVFSDGEDLNSAFGDKVVASEADEISNFEAFCVDYMPGAKTNRFLKTFAENHNGQIWKAKSATELLPIFQAFSTTILYRYVVTYKILDPPSGTLTIEPAELNFEMLTLLNGSPIMHQVFFETGKSEISNNYVLFTHKNQTETFHGKSLSNVHKRYHNILNLIGKKLRLHREQRIRIVGCNSDTGVEKNNLELSRKIEDLEGELDKKKSILQLQEDVISQIDDTKKKIETKLKKQIETQEIRIEEMEGKLKVTFVDKILFDTGSVKIKKRGEALLIEIAESLHENKDQNLRVQGHTDNVQIGSKLAKRFPTNWELSTSRATAVVRFLQEKTGLEPERLSACGYSYYQPVASNDTEEGRHENRRIEIILIPSE